MRIKVFMNTAGHNHERDILRMMHDGIEDRIVPKDKESFLEWRRINKLTGRRNGVEYSYSEAFTQCDLAIMFGSWKPRDHLHHTLRTSIVKSGTPFVCLETPLLGRKVFKPNKHQRVGVNGFLNRDAHFIEDKNYPKDRLEDLDIQYKGWHLNAGNKIIIAMQLAGDASLRHNDISQWCMDTVKTLREHTDRPIEIRTHPGMSNKGWGNYEELFKHFLFNDIKNINFVNGRDTPWEDHLKNAYCVVAYTSGLSIDAIVNGIPVIACDEGNFAWNIGERKLKNIEKLNIAREEDVQQWLQNLAYCQWTPEEMESGKCYDHLKPIIDKVIAGS